MNRRWRTSRIKRVAPAKAIDLFCGCGGLSLGLTQAGFDVIAALDNSELATSSYELNHATTHVITQDIRRVTVKSIMKKTRLRSGQLALLAGCPPCQGFSTVRTRNGRRRPRDRRNYLILDFLRFVRVLRPQAVLLENVPGLAKTALFRRFCDKLNELGYAVNYGVLDAADYGIPQRRKRLIVAASLTHFVRLLPPTVEKKTVREAIGGLLRPERSRDRFHSYPSRHSETVRKVIKAIPRDGGSRKSLPRRLQLACHKKKVGFKDVYGRMSWDSVAPTITAGCINPSKGRFLHPTQSRAITLREAAILQGFPPSYKFSLERGRYQVADMIGNAIPPEFVRYHAALLRETLKKTDWANGG